MTILRKLIDDLSAGRVVPFVDSGVSLAVRSNGAAVFPSWGGLLADMADALAAAGKPSLADIVRLQCQER